MLAGGQLPVDGDAQRAALEAVAAVGPRRPRASNAGSGGQVVVVVVVDGDGLRSWRQLAVPARSRPRAAPTTAIAEEREDGSLHGQAGSPHGCGRPSLPGLRIPWGSSAALVAASTSNASPSAARGVAAAVQADPVVVAQRGTTRERRLDAGIPGGAVEGFTLLHRRMPAEGEVEARAVAVRVREVARRQRPCRRRRGTRRARRRRRAGSADHAPRSPWCRPRSPVSMKCSERGDVVAPLEPVVEQRGIVEGVASAHSSRTTCSTASTIAGSPSSSTSRMAWSSPVSKCRSASMASYSRSTAGVAPRRSMRRHASSPAVNAGEAERGPHLGGGRRVHAQARAGDHPERAFAADEQLVQVGAHRGAGRAAGVHDAAVGEHDVEAEHHVLDLPVAGRQLSRAAARQPAADGGEVDRLGPVAERESWCGAQVGLQGSAEGTGSHVEDERRRRRRATIPVIAVRSSTMPPCTGMLAPHTPLRPAAAVTGTRASLHTRSSAATSALPVGRATAAARGDRGAVVFPDHRQRPPVAAGGRPPRSGSLVDRADPAQPVRAPPPAPRRRCRGAGSPAGARRAVAALVGDRRRGTRRPARRARRVRPAELGRQQRCHLARRPRRTHRARAAGRACGG